MLTRDAFKRKENVVTWRWKYDPASDKDGVVHLDLMDWEGAETAKRSYHITWDQYKTHYQLNGVDLHVVKLSSPALIRVMETQTIAGQTQQVGESMLLPLPARNKFQIQMDRENQNGGLQKLTVTYPKDDCVRFSSYPERMLYFLVCMGNDDAASGAKFYLPRPVSNEPQEFWFDNTAGCRVFLRMDPDAPVGASGLFKAKDVFTIV